MKRGPASSTSASLGEARIGSAILGRDMRAEDSGPVCGRAGIRQCPNAPLPAGCWARSPPGLISFSSHEANVRWMSCSRLAKTPGGRALSQQDACRCVAMGGQLSKTTWGQGAELATRSPRTCATPLRQCAHLLLGPSQNTPEPVCERSSDSSTSVEVSPPARSRIRPPHRFATALGPGPCRRGTGAHCRV